MKKKIRPMVMKLTFLLMTFKKKRLKILNKGLKRLLKNEDTSQ